MCKRTCAQSNVEVTMDELRISDDDDENRPPTVAALAVVGCLTELVAVAAWLLWRLWR